MSFSLKNFIKLLEYENLKEEVFLEKMGSVLNLEYFKDDFTQIHTLAGRSFVLDFCESRFKITFVDPKMNEKFKYVEFYLNYFYENKNKRNLFDFFKYFVSFDQDIERVEREKIECSSVCSCISTYDYCFVSNYNDIINRLTDNDCVFNIYSHRKEFHFYEPCFIPIDKLLIKKETDKKNVEIVLKQLENNFNLSLLYDPSIFNCAIYRKLLTFSKTLCYSTSINNISISLNGDLKLLIGGCYKKKESFLFKKGLTLYEIINLKI